MLTRIAPVCVSHFSSSLAQLITELSILAVILLMIRLVSIWSVKCGRPPVIHTT